MTAHSDCVIILIAADSVYLSVTLQCRTLIQSAYIYSYEAKSVFYM